MSTDLAGLRLYVHKSYRGMLLSDTKFSAEWNEALPELDGPLLSRIVACVNACADVPNAVLVPGLMGTLQIQLQGISAQRDAAFMRNKKWLAVFGHLSHDPDEAGNAIVQKHDELEAQIKVLHAALEMARNGLLWYQDRYPAEVNGCDDEAMAQIDAALK